MSDSHPPVGLDIEELDGDGRCTLLLRGELDIASVGSLQAAVARVSSEPARALTLDLRHLRFIDSTGLAAIVLAGKLCERQDREFALIPGSRTVQRLFEITGLINVLPFLDDADAASDSRGQDCEGDTQQS